MQFSEVIGQQEVKKHLVQVARSGQVAHAQLFLGAEGTGGLPLALAFAQYLTCENPGENDSCGACPSCIKSSRLQHPDIHYSYPVIKKESQRSAPMSAEYGKEWIETIGKDPYITEFDWLQSIKAGNKQGNITAEECRHIIKTLNLKTFESEYKILILWKPETLGLVGNILLKLIEEPPPKTVLLLVAENQEEIIATILSRTQILKIPPIEDSEMEHALVSKLGLSEESARRMAFLANGNFSRARMLATNGQPGYAKLWLDWLVNVMKPLPAELLRWVDHAAGLGREQQKEFLEYCLHFLRETTISMYAGNIPPRVLPDEEPILRSLVKYLDTLEKVTRLVELFEQKIYHIERNANPKITFMDMSLRIQKILKGLPEPVEVPSIV